jgi:hypothetical protein
MPKSKAIRCPVSSAHLTASAPLCYSSLSRGTYVHWSLLQFGEGFQKQPGSSTPLLLACRIRGTSSIDACLPVPLIGSRFYSPSGKNIKHSYKHSPFVSRISTISILPSRLLSSSGPASSSSYRELSYSVLLCGVQRPGVNTEIPLAQPSLSLCLSVR